MSHRDMERFPADLEPVVERLRGDRPEASSLELDRIKLKAMSRASRSVSAQRKSMRVVSRRLSTLAVCIALVGGGGGVLLIAGQGPLSSSSNEFSAASSQYCPPPAAGPPKEKKNAAGGNKCGQPKPKNP
jgi:hypothetical protein